MSYGNLPGRETRPAGREAARDRARELRDQIRKRDRRRSWIIGGSIAGVVVIALAATAWVLLSADRSAGRGPANMASDGIRIGQDFHAELTPSVPLTSQPAEPASNPPGVVDIRIYLDYLSPNAGSFAKVNSDWMRAWIEKGIVTVEYHPIALLTTKSAGTQYSLRAANAAACVAELSPDSFFAFNDALLEEQPEEGTPGLTDDDIIRVASSVGVAQSSKVTDCVREGRFRDWVLAATDRALLGPVPESDVPAIASTPTVIVNGKQFKYANATDPNEFARFVQSAAGEDFADGGTPTVAATPTPAG